MKLALDEHYSPLIAVQLRDRGYDVIAVAESPDLRELPDQELLLWAQREQRVVVTENVGDIMMLHHAFLSRGELHAGMLFTSSRAFPRRKAAIGHLVTALAGFMDHQVHAETLQGDIAWL